VESASDRFRPKGSAVSGNERLFVWKTKQRPV
jgi:hypothetical protein